MPIYTKTGDKGETSLFGGKRISKSDLQVEAYGSADELSSHLGLIISKGVNKRDKQLLASVQSDLYKMMAFLSNSKVDLEALNDRVKSFEQSIDKTTSKLPKLHRFILPQGGEIASLFHISRTVCRRAERAVIREFLSKKTLVKDDQQLIVKYLNRLSDLLFTFARKYTKGKEVVT